MDTLACILYLYPTAVLYRDFTLLETNGAVAIDQWLSTTLAQPTQAQLDTAWATVSVQQAQTAQIALLQQSFEAAFTAPVAYMSTNFPADQATQQLLVHAHAAKNAKGGTLPANFYALDVNRSKVAMTAAQLDGLVSAIFDQGFAAWDHLNTRIAQVMAATTVSAVQAVVW